MVSNAAHIELMCKKEEHKADLIHWNYVFL